MSVIMKQVWSLWSLILPWLWWIDSTIYFSDLSVCRSCCAEMADPVIMCWIGICSKRRISSKREFFRMLVLSKSAVSMCTWFSRDIMGFYFISKLGIHSLNLGLVYLWWAKCQTGAAQWLSVYCLPVTAVRNRQMLLQILKSETWIALCIWCSLYYVYYTWFHNRNRVWLYCGSKEKFLFFFFPLHWILTLIWLHIPGEQKIFCMIPRSIDTLMGLEMSVKWSPLYLLIYSVVPKRSVIPLFGWTMQWGNS